MKLQIFLFTFLFINVFNGILSNDEPKFFDENYKEGDKLLKTTFKANDTVYLVRKQTNGSDYYKWNYKTLKPSQFELKAGKQID